MTSRTFYHVPSPSPSNPTPTATPITIDPSNFNLTTTPGTDLWRPSFTGDRFDAPYIYTPVRSGSFINLTTTISGAWKSKFDQGCLLLYWPSTKQNESKWLKAGIEFFEGRPALSVVGTDRLSDWSLCPLLEEGDGPGEATLRVEREGSTLWVSAVLEGGEKRALREIKWAWTEGREADAELWVGVCVAKPAEEEGEGELEVTFRNWKLEVKE